jgi:hypothetical protein
MTRSLVLGGALLIAAVMASAAHTSPIEVVSESPALRGPLTAEIRTLTYGPELIVFGPGPGIGRQFEAVFFAADGSVLWAAPTDAMKLFDLRVSLKPAGVVDGTRVTKIIIRDQTPETVAARERIMPEVLRRISAEEAAKEAEATRRREAERQARAAAVRVGPDPDSFRGVPWRASEEETKKIHAERGEYLSCVAGRICYDSAAGIGPVRAHISFSFQDGQFTHALITFKPESFATLRRIFVERYGEPTSETEEPYQTKGGIKTTNPIVRWVGQRVWIEIRGYGGKITEGRASLMLRDEIDKGVREREKAIQKGKGDL